MNIDRHIKDLIFQLGLSVVYCEDMDSNGHYIELIDVIAVKSGLNELDEECNINIVTKDKITTSNLEYAISNSLGFGGHNAVLALRKWSE